jgi:peroxiredoxin
MNGDLTRLPANLPRPKDDGSCNHLLGMNMPNIVFPSTKGNTFDIGNVDSQLVILYFFPNIAISEKSLPSGWDSIPGARGCTPQNIAVSAHVKDLLKHDTMPIGISSQHIDELSEISKVRGFSQVILSDNNLEFHEKMNIPTFQVDGKTMYKRVTLVVQKSKIIKVFYPVFPPDKHIFEILKWLEHNHVK